jgi:hypothetical protein
MKTFSLFLLMGFIGAAELMPAGTMQYTFNFTGGSPNATGSFQFVSYDNFLLDQFLNVNLSWDGVQFDSRIITSDFNSVIQSEFCNEPGGVGLVDILTKGSCGGATWTASSENQGGPGVELFSIDICPAGVCGFYDFAGVVTNAPLVSTSGTVSATATTPEPDSFSMCIVGAALLACAHRKRGASTNHKSPSLQ